MEKEQIQNLLAELDGIKGPEELPNWNMKAQALLVFIACKYPLGVVGKNEVELEIGCYR